MREGSMCALAAGAIISAAASASNRCFNEGPPCVHSLLSLLHLLHRLLEPRRRSRQRRRRICVPLVPPLVEVAQLHRDPVAGAQLLRDLLRGVVAEQLNLSRIRKLGAETVLAHDDATPQAH